MKITALLGLTLTTVCVENLYLYAALFTLILLLIPTASLRYVRVLAVLKKLRFVILSAVLLPLWFNAGSRDLLVTPLGTLHLEATVNAAVFGGRIALLALISTLVAQTTSPQAFTKGIAAFLRPLDRLGLDSAGVAATISSSIAALPEVWGEIRSLINALTAGKRRDLLTLKNAVVLIFVYLFAAYRRS
jgi:energy-coupling factor transporter transmembrane protein EcfT